MGRKKGQTLWEFTTLDLGNYLRISRSHVIRLAHEIGILTWNHSKTRYTPFTAEQAKAIIALKRLRSTGPRRK